jgi:hypothetical protein
MNSDKLQNLCSSTHMISMIKSKSIRLHAQVAGMSGEKCILRFSRKPEGKKTLGTQAKM